MGNLEVVEAFLEVIRTTSIPNLRFMTCYRLKMIISGLSDAFIPSITQAVNQLILTIEQPREKVDLATALTAMGTANSETIDRVLQLARDQKHDVKFLMEVYETLYTMPGGDSVMDEVSTLMNESVMDEPDLT